MAHRRRDLVEISSIVQQQEARWADDGISEGSMDSLDRRILGIPPLESQSRPPIRSRTAGLSNMLREKPASMTHQEWMALLLAQRQAQMEGLAARLRGDDGSRAGSSLHSGVDEIMPALAPNPYLEPKFANIQRRMREGLAAIKNNNHRVEELSVRSPSPVKRQRHIIAIPPRQARPVPSQQHVARDDQEELETMDDIKRSLDRRRTLLDHRALSPTPPQVRPSRRPYNSRFGRADVQEERKIPAAVIQEKRAPQASRIEAQEEPGDDIKEASAGLKELRALSKLLHNRPAPETAEWEAMLKRTSRSSDSLPPASAAIDVAELQRDAATEVKEAHTLPVDSNVHNAAKDSKGKDRALDTDREANMAKEMAVLPERRTNAWREHKHLKPIREKSTNTFENKDDILGSKPAKEPVASKLEDEKDAQDDNDATKERASSAETKANVDKEDSKPVKEEVDVDDSIMDKTLEQFAATRELKPARTKAKPTNRKIITSTTSEPRPTPSTPSDDEAYQLSLSIKLPTRSRFLAYLVRSNPSSPCRFSLTWPGTLLALLFVFGAWYALETLVHYLIGKPTYVVPGQNWDIHAPIWGDAIPTLLERILGEQVGWMARLPKKAVVEWPTVARNRLYEWAIEYSFSEMEREAMRLGCPIAALYRSEIAGVGEFSMSMDEEVWINE